MPRVSVVLPNYNYARYLPQRIDSILNQSFQDFELIILDDCSTDASREVIEAYKSKHDNIFVYYNAQNSGSPFIQWDKGIKLAKGEFIWIAEADDWADSSLLLRLVEILERSETVGIAYCQSYKMGVDGELQGLWTEQQTYDPSPFRVDFSCQGCIFIKDYLIRDNVIPNASAVLIRREAYNEIGGVDRVHIGSAIRRVQSDVRKGCLSIGKVEQRKQRVAQPKKSRSGSTASSHTLLS